MRTVDVAEPYAFTSMKSRVYRAEASVGGPGGPNWVALCTSSGVTNPSHGSNIDRKPGGVGRQTPGAGGWVNRIGASRPSLARDAIKLSAARIPKVMPFAFAVPSGICASELAYAASRVARAYGK